MIIPTLAGRSKRFGYIKVCLHVFGISLRKLVVISIGLIVFLVYVLSVFSQEVGPSTVGHTQTYSIPSTEYLGNRYCLSLIYNIKIDSLSEKASLRFTSKQDVEVQKARVYFNVYGLPGDVRIGVQEDDGEGEPSGTYLGYQNVTVVSKEKWYVATLSPPIALSKNSVYHVVITPTTGYDADNYILVWVNYPNNKMYPYDQEPDENLNSLFYDGGSWSVQDRDPEFLLDLTSGEHIGITYNFLSHTQIYGKERAGEEFLVKGNSCVVKGVSAYLKRGTTLPEDDLFVNIYDVTDSSWVVRDEKFCSPSDVEADYSWVDHRFKEAHVLEKGKTYRVFWESPGTSSDCVLCRYRMRRITSESLDPYAKVTYDGLDAYYVSGETDPPTLTCLRSDVVYSLSLVTAVKRVPEEYQTIQGAINEAYPGDTILVSSGTYCEHVVVNKSVSLFGESKNNTIIDGNGTSTILGVIADDVYISGFTVHNGSRGISVDGFDNVSICENVMSNSDRAVFLSNSNNCTVRGNTISNCRSSIELWSSNGTMICGNTISNMRYGVYLLFTSCGNVIEGNIVSHSPYEGISLSWHCNHNTVVGNTVTLCADGIVLGGTNGNVIHHNNFVDNMVHVYSYNSSNAWDDGVEGNYWSDYKGLDDGSGGRVAGDGVGDTSLPHHVVDYCPLIVPQGPIPVFWRSVIYPVSIVGNSTVSEFDFSQSLRQISFDVSVSSGSVGFCNVTFPNTLLWGDFIVRLDDASINLVRKDNATHISVWFSFESLSTRKVTIIGEYVIPEFSTWTPMLFTLTVLAVALVLYKRNTRTGCSAKTETLNNRKMIISSTYSRAINQDMTWLNND